MPSPPRGFTEAAGISTDKKNPQGGFFSFL